MLELQFFFFFNKKNCYCDKQLLVSKKVTLVVSPKVKLQLDVILVLSNMIMELSNVRKKKGIIVCDKSTVRSDVGTTQCNNRTVKCEKKQSTTECKGTIKCDKRTITCDVGTAQCEDEIVKCEKKINKPLKQKYSYM